MSINIAKIMLTNPSFIFKLYESYAYFLFFLLYYCAECNIRDRGSEGKNMTKRSWFYLSACGLMFLVILIGLAFIVTGVLNSPAHIHSLTHIDAVPATCQNSGNCEYWHCEKCNTYYADKMGETEIAYETTMTDPLPHSNFIAESKKSSCTDDGYIKNQCSVCGIYSLDLQLAGGHTYSAWTVTSDPTCTAKGEQQRTCDRCNDVQTQSIDYAQHHYEQISNVVEDQITYINYECNLCHDIQKVADGEYVRLTQVESIVRDCPNNYAFTLRSSLDEASIRENLTIIDRYFEGTEYESESSVFAKYKLINLGEGEWRVEPEENYVAGVTYIARATGDILLGENDSSRLMFTIDHEKTETVTLRDDILYLHTLEKDAPGYYPYSMSLSAAGNMYVSVCKIDGIAIGDILCVGEVENYEDMLAAEANSFVFGKIIDIQEINPGEFMIKMVEPELGEVFGEFDVSNKTEVNFDTMDFELDENFEQQAVDALLASEDFISFLASVNLASDTYLSIRSLDTEVLKESSFLDGLTLTPNISYEGNLLVVNIEGKLEIPIKARGEEIGSIVVHFLAGVQMTFEINAECRLRWFLFAPTGIRYFDLSVRESDVMTFEFSITFNVDYTLTGNEYLSNYLAYETKAGTTTLHIAECHRLERSDIDKDKIEKLTQDQMLRRHYAGDAECLICKPVTRLENTRYVVNTNTNVFHLTSCKDLKNANILNLVTTPESAKDLQKRYTACNDCHPERRDKYQFEQELLASTEYASWAETVGKISQWAKEGGIEEKQEKKFTVLHLYYPITVIDINLDINLVLQFKLSASANYTYEVRHLNVFGIQNTGKGFKPYSIAEKEVTKNDLVLMGRAEFRFGVEIDIYAGILGLSSLANAGVSGEIGIYAELAGILHLSGVNPELNYAAAYLDCGIYVNVNAHYTLLWWNGNADLVDVKFPLLQLGYDRAYYAFVNGPEQIELSGDLVLSDGTFMNVLYFDLLSMSDKNDTLSLQGVEGQYTVILSLADGEHCSIRKNTNDAYYIDIDADAPCRFTDTLTISVTGNNDWKAYVKGRGAMYLDDYTIHINYCGDTNHIYTIQTCTSETLRSPANCTAQATYWYICEDCDTISNTDYFSNGDMLSHVHTREMVSDATQRTPATCTATATYWYACNNCDDISNSAYFSVGNLAAHTYTREVVSTGTKKDDATCTTQATYWYTCATCDSVSTTSSFASGATLPHVHEREVVSSTTLRTPASCTAQATYWYTCNDCADVSDSTYYSTGNLAAHTYTREVVSTGTKKDDATCTTQATYWYTCANCDSASTTSYFSSGNLENHNFVDGACSKCGASNGTAGLVYTLSEDEASYSITGIGTCADTDLVIPSTHASLPVLSIGPEAFSGCTTITSVTIPEGVTSIASSAFEGCTKLSSVSLSKSITFLGAGAFWNCEELSAVHITDLAAWCQIEFEVFSNPLQFANCLYLNGEKIESLVIPDHIESISKFAFHGYIGLTSVTVPETIANVGAFAFYNCINLSSATINNGVKTIGNGAFGYCSTLISITIPDSVTSISENAFSHCSELTTVTIGNGVETIGNNAFSGCIGLTSVTIPSSVASLGTDAFYDCAELTAVHITDLAAWCQIRFSDSYANPLYYADYLYLNGEEIIEIVIPGSVTNIGSYAFYGYTALNSLTIEEGVKAISNNAFYCCDNLRSVSIPNSLTSIDSYAFYDCSSLSSITLGKSIANIGYYAFYNCSNLITLAIPDSITKIDGSAFYNCDQLVAVHITDLAAWCRIDFDGSFANPLYYAKHLYLNGKEVKNLIIPDSITDIGTSAFAGCTGLTSVTIHGKVTSVGIAAFSGCTELASVTIGNGVKTIDNHAFLGCTKLTSVVIPNSVTSIGYDAFSGCSGLTSVTIGNGVTTIGGDAFSGCIGLTSIAIPNSVTSIGDRAFYGCSELTSVTIGEGVTTIGGDAFEDCTGLTAVHISDLVAWCQIDFVMDRWVESYSSNYSSNPLCYAKHLYLNGSEVKELVIPNGVTNINAGAFNNCAGLTSVTIPNSVTTIGNYAFYGCSGLTSVTIGNGVTSISDRAFYGCTELASVTIPDSVTTIGSYAFYGCSGLTSVIIGNGVEAIGGGAFYGCSKLASISLPFTGASKTATNENSLFGYIFGSDLYAGSIAVRQYYSNDSYETYYIPASLTNVTILGESINYGAFYGCEMLTSVVIGSEMKNIDTNAFYGCYKLIEIYNLSSLTITAGSSANGHVGYYAKNVYTPSSGTSKLLMIDDFVFYVNGNVQYLMGYLGSESELVLPNTCNEGAYKIHPFAFHNHTWLTAVTIGNHVTDIGQSAFRGCAELTSIRIPSSVTGVDVLAFDGCTKLSSVYITDLTAWCQIKFNAFLSSFAYSSNPLYYAKHLYINDTEIKNLIIPEGVTSISSGAFYGFVGLSSVTISENVTYIGNSAFNGCTGLTSVTIPDSVTRIGYAAFSGCTGLTSLTFADTSAWYRTTNSADWSNRTGGTETDLSDPADNATYFTSTYDNYYWYKQ